MAEKLKVEYVDIGTLKPYAGNAKRRYGGCMIWPGVITHDTQMEPSGANTGPVSGQWKHHAVYVADGWAQFIMMNRLIQPTR